MHKYYFIIINIIIKVKHYNYYLIMGTFSLNMFNVFIKITKLDIHQSYTLLKKLENPNTPTLIRDQVLSKP